MQFYCTIIYLLNVIRYNEILVILILLNLLFINKIYKDLLTLTFFYHLRVTRLTLKFEPLLNINPFVLSIVYIIVKIIVNSHTFNLYDINNHKKKQKKNETIFIYF